MKPIEFKEFTGLVAQHQLEYETLPVWMDKDRTISKWKFTLIERITLLFTGTLWFHQLNYGKPNQPVDFTLFDPFNNEFGK